VPSVYKADVETTRRGEDAGWYVNVGGGGDEMYAGLTRPRKQSEENWGWAWVGSAIADSGRSVG
jgi:hypothetical protein